MKNSKVKTLVIITPGFPENEADSTCVPPQQVFVKALKEVSPQLNVVVLSLQYPFHSNEYYWHGIKVIPFGGGDKGKLFRLFTGLRVYLALRKLAAAYELTGLLSFWFGKCAHVANGFAKRYGLPHYSWILGQDAKPGNKYFNKIKPDGGSLIALSDFIVREFNKNYGVLPQHIVPVGIDPGLFCPADTERDIDILGAGSLIPLKQYHIFLEVIRSLKEFHPNIKAAICGDGPEMKLLHTMVIIMGLEDNITLMGRLSHQEVLAQMQRCKVFLHPSNYEGFGAVCLEALYAGARVVSFVRPMNKAIRNWHIADDQEHMIQLSHNILKCPDLGHQPVMPFSIHENARKILKLYDQDNPAICSKSLAIASKERLDLK